MDEVSSNVDAKHSAVEKLICFDFLMVEYAQKNV